MEQLAAAGVPNRTVFDVRRRLAPVAVAAEVLANREMQEPAVAADEEVSLPLVVVC